MQEETKPIGQLFESINYYNQEDLIKFIENINAEQSFYIITQALEMGLRRGLYSLQEAEILSKSLRNINMVK
jgi:hypothetical protein